MSDREAASRDTAAEGTTAEGTTAIIGVGVMGETLLSGLLRAGWSTDSLVIGERRSARADELQQRLGVAFLDNGDAAARADMVALVVKPQDIGDVLDQIAPRLAPGTLVVSLAAGVPTSSIEKHLPAGTPVVRVMPNTPAQVAEGMAAVSAGSSATDAHVARVMQMMGAVGRAVEVPEKYQDAVTAISGSGPAYLFFVVEAMVEAGVHLGLPRATASELVVQTMYGSAKLLRESGQHPTVLRENVTSPGGTTAAAIRGLEDHGVRAAFLEAMEAARDRSADLAKGA